MEGVLRSITAISVGILAPFRLRGFALLGLSADDEGRCAAGCASHLEDGVPREINKRNVVA
jgi:hypothetical protein